VATNVDVVDARELLTYAGLVSRPKKFNNTGINHTATRITTLSGVIKLCDLMTNISRLSGAEYEFWTRMPVTEVVVMLSLNA
jgi:hypothetical protein